MSTGKLLTGIALVMFAVIGIAALFKGGGKEPEKVVVLPPAPPVAPEMVPQPAAVAAEVKLPDADRMDEFFNVGLPKLPIVQTVTYSAKVPWKKGQAAWVSDYAAHFGTSRHLIARSLNGERDYDKQVVANGDRFNVFVEDRPVSFHLVVDHSRCRMWVYYLDEETDERVLVKTCPVGLGRPDQRKLSGSLTPFGTYTLGEKIAVYRPGKTGLYNNQKTEMLSVFGSRWIPFEEEVGQCTLPAKGLGLHGCPWMKDESGEWCEDLSGLGGYQSDGCIRLKTEDMEELFAVIITKPTTIYLVDDYFNAELPGKDGYTSS
jgi:L,D-transpeptidase catalytic domain